MELDTGERPVLDRRHDPAFVVDRGRGERGVGRFDREAVGEVHVGAIDPFEERRRPRCLERVPAHVRHSTGPEPSHRAGKEAEALPTLLALAEQELEPNADARDRPARSDALTKRAIEPAPLAVIAGVGHDRRIDGDDHHVAEAAYKALGQSFRQAVAPGDAGIRSTKGLA